MSCHDDMSSVSVIWICCRYVLYYYYAVINHATIFAKLEYRTNSSIFCCCDLSSHAIPTKSIINYHESTSPKKEDRHTKGGRGSRPPARDGKRTYDRRSGTGRGRDVKKGGGGGHNWGSNQNDAKKAEGPVTEGKEDVNTPESEEAVAAETEEKEDAAEEKEPEPEEDKTLSYEEYLAQKARPDSEAFKPLESREVDNEFAGKAAAKKETEDFLVMGGGKGPRKKGSGKKEKEKLVLDFKVKSAISEDRGGGRR